MLTKKLISIKNTIRGPKKMIKLKPKIKTYIVKQSKKNDKPYV